MTKAENLADAQERLRAATTFDRNVVVTAGAGTGKTTLLVDRLVHLIMREPEPLEITHIVALTFTNKAANEMKSRLRERLHSYLDTRLDQEPTDPWTRKAQEEIRSLLSGYHLTKDKVDHRAREALRQFERGEIGTLHSFAATLLRLYPMEAGIDPQFTEDDGARFERHFEESWTSWLDHELSAQGARHPEWKEALKKSNLMELRALALTLCSETVPLERLAERFHDQTMPRHLLQWLKSMEEKAARLVQTYPVEQYQIDRLIRATLRIVREFLARGALEKGAVEEERELLANSEPRIVKSWNDEEFEHAKELIRIARHLCQIEEPFARLLVDLLLPFATLCRESFIKQGWISFDGLLVRARNLVRDHPSVREDLKRHFKAILIDEFQDTDPIQYEILLYLAETIGAHARHWRDVRLTPGKIFVVGDPKQSIYAFRRADIQAYLEVVKDIIEAQDGIECRLTTNFRSHVAILDVVNGVFQYLIRPMAGLQPPYVAIHPPEPDDLAPTSNAEPPPFRKTVIRRVECDQADMNAEQARRLEAESLARWLEEEVLHRAEVIDREGRRVLATAKDVAILLRKLTDVHLYLEPLRQRGIRYVVEGERHFYAAQEVIDAVNLLRTVENPYDRSALVGILRSPIGGLKDAEIYQIHKAGLLDYRSIASKPSDGKANLLGLVKQLYEILYRLHEETRKLPVGQAVGRIFASVPIRLLAAHSFHGEQVVANLEKVRLVAELLGKEGLGTLRDVIGRLQGRVLQIKEEGESVLAEENVDAVKILSVHKAKGLEFPIVVLAGCHTAIDLREEPVALDHDWSTGMLGLRVGERWTLAGLYLSEKRRLREREEQKRVLYVAMTRAREHLMLSYAVTDRSSGASFLSMLSDAIGDVEAVSDSRALPVGNGTIELRQVVERPALPRPQPKSATPQAKPEDWKAYVELWRRRTAEYERILKEPRFLTPTLLKRSETRLGERGHGKEKEVFPSSEALLVGDLAHGFLQEWDFRSDTEHFGSRLSLFMERRLEKDSAASHAKVQRELKDIFQHFFSSKAYRELYSALILGREVPFCIPWNGQIMEGVIDLMYERDGLLYIADYKTDRIERGGLEKSADTYRHQIHIYSEAVRRSLKRDVTAFKLIFLRLGEAFEVRAGIHPDTPRSKT